MLARNRPFTFVLSASKISASQIATILTNTNAYLINLSIPKGLQRVKRSRSGHHVMVVCTKPNYRHLEQIRATVIMSKFTLLSS